MRGLSTVRVGELGRGVRAGTFFETMPRHRLLLSINKVHTGHDDPELNLRWDWNSLLTDDEQFRVGRYSSDYFPNADRLVEYLRDFARQSKLKIHYDVSVVCVERRGDGFVLRDSHVISYGCKWLVIATGLSQPYLPDIPGIQWAEHYANVSTDPSEFLDQRVLIIGKGNSAFETANNLLEHAAVVHLASRHSVTFAWDTHHIGDLRSVNNDFLDTYLLKAQNATLEATIQRIERVDDEYEVSIKYHRARNSTASYRYDRIIACTGFRFANKIFDDQCQPEMMIDNRLPALTSCWESTNVSNMYFAGTLMQSRDYKKTSSAFIHGFRYNIRALHRILEQRNHGRAWPSIKLGSWFPDVLSMIIRRLNGSSGMWLQYGFIGDLVIEPSATKPGRYLEDVPVDYSHSTELCADRPHYVVTLEYGRSDFDPLHGDRVSHTDVEHGAESTALHPVIRRYQGEEMIDELHVVENLEAVWCDEKLHVEPLRRFLTRE